MKTYFELTIIQQAKYGTKAIHFVLIPNVKIIVEDMFGPGIDVDSLGDHSNFIFLMLVNVQVMNMGTGHESFF